MDFAASRVLTSLPGLIFDDLCRRYRPVALLSAVEHADLVTLSTRGLARVPRRSLFVVRAGGLMGRTTSSIVSPGGFAQLPVPDRFIKRRRVS